MKRRVRFEALAQDPIVVRFEIDGYRPRFMLSNRIQRKRGGLASMRFAADQLRFGS